MVESASRRQGVNGGPPPGLATVLARLLAADPSSCDREGLAGLVAQSQRVRGWLDAFDARIAIRAADLAAQGSCESAGSVLAGRGRRSQRDAERAAARAGVCEDLPTVGDALSEGSISAGHVDAIVAAAAQLGDDAGATSQLADLEESLLDAARVMPVETFERECQNLARILAGDDGTSRHERHRKARRVRRWVDRQTGMAKTLIELDAETDAVMWTAINAAIAAARANVQDDGLTFDQLQVDALVALITGARSADHRVPEISVLIDIETLLRGVHDRSVCETSDGAHLPVETIRRMCCDGDIVPVVLGGAGEVLDVGRSQRLATRAQRRALRAMHRSCAHPDCHATFDHCRIHHVMPWEHGGPTDLDHLVPLCDRHHHLVHEGGWTLTLQPDRTITLQRPDGTISFTGTTADRTHPPDPTPHPTETDGRGLENNEAPTRPTAAGAGPTDVVTPTPPPANRLDPDEASTGPVDPDHPAADQPVRVPDWVFDLFDHRIERRPAAPTGPARAHTTAKTDRPVHTDRRVATRPLTSPTLSARPPP